MYDKPNLIIAHNILFQIKRNDIRFPQSETVKFMVPTWGKHKFGLY